jgi:hypothetical protein
LNGANGNITHTSTGATQQNVVIAASTVNDLPAFTASATQSSICSSGSTQLQASASASASASAYCIPTYTVGASNGDYVSLVQLNTLNNSSVGSASPYYTLFPALGSTTTTLTANNPYTITLSGGTYSSDNYLAAWIDYNQNGIFEASEKVAQSGNLGATPATASFGFIVPSTALSGQTRLRVRQTYNNNNMNPCTNYDDGETEDYVITMIGGSNAYTYSWSPATFLSATNIANPVASNVTATTTYTVTATNPTSGCTNTSNVTITVNPLPTITGVSAASVTSAATTFSLVYTGTSNSPTTYSLVSAGTATPMTGFVPVTDAALTASPLTITIPASAANTYTFNLTVKNALGCVSAVVPLTLVVASSSSPEINLVGNGNSIPSGTTAISTTNDTDFGMACTAITRTFTIQNTNTGALNLTGNPIVAISGSSDFVISTQPTANTIAASGSLTFAVTYTPNLATAQTATISIANNDSDENPYTFNVSGMKDNIAPTLTALSNVSKNANTGVCTFTNTASSIPNGVASDNCTGMLTYSYVLNGATNVTVSNLLNQVFNTGVTTVTWTATDASGNVSASSSFTVTVVDTQIPILALYSDLEIIISGSLLDEVSWKLTNSSSTIIASGGNYSFGSTNSIIVNSITDYPLTFFIEAQGNFNDNNPLAQIKTLSGIVLYSSVTPQTTTSTFVIGVQDKVVNADNSVCTYTHSSTNWDINFTDNCSVTSLSYTLSGVTTGTGTTLNGTAFNLGITTVVWTATDAAGNTTTSSFTVTVVDTQLPTLTALSNISRNANAGTCTFTNAASSIPNGVASDNCSVASYEYVLTGATTGTVSTLATQIFNLGITTVTWTAKDGSNNVSVSSSFTVTVVDTQLPTLTALSNVSRNANAGVCTFTNAASSIPNGVASDNCSVASYSYVLSGATLVLHKC